MKNFGYWGIVLSFLYLLVLPASAQEYVQSDPEGGKHALAIYFAGATGDEVKIEALVRKNPLLTKRAFLASLEYAESKAQESPTEAKQSLDFAGALAAVVKELFDDSTPQEIMSLYLAGDQQAEVTFLEYCTEVYPAYNRAPSVELLSASAAQPTPPGMDPEVVKANLRYETNLARILTAGAFTDLQLMLGELNIHARELQRYITVLKAHQLYTPEKQSELEKHSVGVAIAKLGISTELGLLDEFDQESESLFQREAVVDYRIPSYMGAFGVAHRQGEYARARKYLSQARRAAESPENQANPVYLYLLETADFQLQLAEEKTVSAEDTLMRFDQAWSRLDTFRPIEMMEESAAWQQGRFATKVWLGELRRLGPEGQKRMETILFTYARWVKTFEDPEHSRRYYDGTDPHLFLKRQGSAILGFSMIEGTLAVLEANTQLLTEQTMKDVKGLTGGLSGLMVDTSRELQHPDFPSFELTKGPYFEELTSQLAYLTSLVPGYSVEARREALVKAFDTISALRRPEPYIDFHLKVGSQFSELGDSIKAIEAWQRALARAEEAKFARLATRAAALLAKEYASLEDWAQVGVYAAKAKQNLQSELGSTDARPQETEGLSHLSAQAHIKSDDPMAGLDALNQGHQASTAASQLSSNPGVTSANQALDKQRKKVAVLSQQVQTLKNLPDTETRNEILGKTEKLLAQSRSEFLSQSRKIRQQYSRLYTTALRFDPLNLPDIQAALPKETAVVQYFATEKELFIFVVTPKQFRLRSVPESKASLDASIISFLRRVQRPGKGDVELDETGSALYRVLVSPIEADLEGITTLVLIPSGKLNVLPFGALTDSTGKPFIESKTLLELAKTTDFMKIAQSSARPVTTVVAFANATLDLPAAAKEGQSIQAVFPGSKLFLGVDASRENFLKFGHQADVLHLATHGIWDASNSLNNHLQLSKSQKLGQDEIFNLNLEETSIVTLSACSTALGDVKETEYVASLAEAFWIAGSRSVVASLWPVDDDSTGLLMTHFYGRLKAGDGKAVALQKAQLEVRKNPEYTHPYYWSGFLLFGDYR